MSSALAGMTLRARMVATRKPVIALVIVSSSTVFAGAPQASGQGEHGPANPAKSLPAPYTFVMMRCSTEHHAATIAARRAAISAELPLEGAKRNNQALLFRP